VPKVSQSSGGDLVKSRIAAAVAAALALACATQSAIAQNGSLSLSLARARTELGVFNVELFPVGTLFVRSAGSSTMTHIDTLTVAPEALQRPESAGLTSVNASSGFDVDVSLGFWSWGDAAAIKAEAKRQAKLYVKDVTTERLRSPIALLNAPENKPLRQGYAAIGQSYGADIVYELVHDVKRVNEGGLGFGRPFRVDGKLSFPKQVGLKGLSFAVNYDNTAGLEFGGKQSPMFYRTQAFRLMPVGDDYRFVPYVPRASAPARRRLAARG
jgi:hypothetical protein